MVDALLAHPNRVCQGQRAVLMLVRTVGPLASILQVRREKVDDHLPRFETTLRQLCRVVYERYAFIADPSAATKEGRHMPYQAYMSFLQVPPPSC